MVSLWLGCRQSEWLALRHLPHLILSPSPSARPHTWHAAHLRHTHSRSTSADWGSSS